MKRSEAGVKSGCTFKHCSGNSYQEVVPGQEKTRNTCLSLNTVVCWVFHVFSTYRMWTVKQHKTSKHVETTPFFITKKRECLMVSLKDST
jgi:hypothetical protein